MFQNAFHLIFKLLRRVTLDLGYFLDSLKCNLLFYCNLVNHSNYKTKGTPKIIVARGGTMKIGPYFRMNNTIAANPIGCVQPCIFFVDKGANLVIGKSVNMSQTAVICHLHISIGDNVKLGGGVYIYDTDFHSLNPEIRKNEETDLKNKNKSPVVIEKNVFIGAHSIILKGVTIGENSIVGAGSVVPKSIPPNEIWAGNPVRKVGDVKF